MTSREITAALVQHFDWRTNVIVPRCTFPGWEADLLVMRPSGWMEEIEIKISEADFKRDFTTKAPKHRWLTCGHPKWIIDRKKAPAGHDLELVGKHGCLDWSDPDPHMIKRFWFAVPSELVLKIDALVPEYAGLLSVSRLSSSRRSSIDVVKILRPAPALKRSRKLTDEEQRKVLRLGYMRYWGAELKIVNR